MGASKASRCSIHCVSVCLCLKSCYSKSLGADTNMTRKRARSKRISVLGEGGDHGVLLEPPPPPRGGGGSRGENEEET